MNVPTPKIIASSYNLYKQLLPHQLAGKVGVSVINGCCTLYSVTGQTTLPVEGPDCEGELPLRNLLPALKELGNQPIVIAMPLIQFGVLHAAKNGDDGEYIPLQFIIN